MKKREYYEKLFADYPDLVTVQQFREMLGGIANSTARKLIRENIVQHYYIRTTYFIPKVAVINYVLSEHYANYKNKLRKKI